MDRRKIDHERLIYVTVDFALNIAKNVARGLYHELQKDIKKRNTSGHSLNSSDDLIETSKDLIARIDTHGIPKKDIIVDLTEEKLVVEADHGGRATLIKGRRRKSKLKKVIKLPKRIVVDDSNADIEGGVLTVTMPKKIKKIKYEVR